jgi:hypothetical protein
MSLWQRVDPQEALSWTKLSLREVFTGIPPSGFEATARVLHAVFESSEASQATYDDVEKQIIDDGTLEPLIIGEVNLSARTTNTGVPLGIASRPQGWGRVIWRDLADRYDTVLDAANVNALRPLQRAIGSSWPISLQPPPQGSLDTESLEALASILGRRTGGQGCYFYYCMLGVRDTPPDEMEPRVYRGSLSGILDLAYSDEVSGSPQNWWPADHSWLVYTDWDLCDTTIGGSRALIADLRESVEIETFVDGSSTN